jgi:hypothetical protein
MPYYAGLCLLITLATLVGRASAFLSSCTYRPATTPALASGDSDMPSRVPTIEFYVIRHGESTGNRDGVLQGQMDYPLTDTGKAHCFVASILY